MDKNNKGRILILNHEHSSKKIYVYINKLSHINIFYMYIYLKLLLLYLKS